MAIDKYGNEIDNYFINDSGEEERFDRSDIDNIDEYGNQKRTKRDYSKNQTLGLNTDIHNCNGCYFYVSGLEGFGNGMFIPVTKTYMKMFVRMFKHKLKKSNWCLKWPNQENVLLVGPKEVLEGIETINDMGVIL